MSFCPNCGRELAEGEVCNCTPAKEEAPAASKQPSKKSKLIIAAVLAVLVLIIVAAILSPKAKTPIKKLTKAFNNEKSLVLVDGVLPKKLVKIAEEITGTEDTEGERDLQAALLDDYFQNLDSTYEKWSVKIKFKEKTDVSADYYQDNLRQVGDTINTYLDWTDTLSNAFGSGDESSDLKQTVKQLKKFAKYYSKIKISKAVKLDCVVTVKADGNKEEKEVSFIMGKVSGKWYIISYNGSTFFDKATAFNKYLNIFYTNKLDYLSSSLGY